MIDEKEIKKINQFFHKDHLFRTAKVAWIYKCFAKSEILKIDCMGNCSENFDANAGFYFYFEVFFIKNGSLDRFFLTINFCQNGRIEDINECRFKMPKDDAAKEVVYCSHEEKDRMREHIVSML